MFFIKSLIPLSFVVLILITASCVNGKNSDSAISYNSHIRPIISDKCFKCHGPDANQRMADFRLDTPEGAYKALKNSDHAGIVAGNAESSEVFLRITSLDPDYMMPPPESNLSLTLDEIDIIKRWINQGAEYQEHWAFLPINNSAVPSNGQKWATNPIDNFIFQKLESKGLSPNDEQDPYRLIRRMLHDITGLPPTIEQQESFASSRDLNKHYEQLVDQALASKHYGEKMAILWMDIARYADSHGYQDDGLRTMWPWRDWVIHAFNENYSYDKFITWQLAGDLLPESTKETLLATGFNRNHKITQEGGVIDEEYRIEYVSDRTNTFSKGLLAMTMECAKCHDHKYDPISQEDYYSTFAFFNQVPEKGFFGDISVFSLADPPYMTITEEDKKSILNFVSRLDTSDVRVMIMQDSSVLRPTYVLNRGVYDQPTTEVTMTAPASILKFDPAKYASNRLGLAQWLFANDNPLTARVFVNLMWQEFFGHGIVGTSGDFGLQGDLPSHPELLDWLAYDFRSNGWDVKRLVKQIVMSSTYRQSQEIPVDKYAKDPDNMYLSRGPRVRLSAELVKDHVLFTSGLINLEVGGPSVKPYQPAGLWEAATSGRGQLAEYVQDTGDALYRRGLYHFIKRTVPPPSMLIFDASNRDQCEVKRLDTNTPLQALVLLNDPHVLEASRYFAERLIAETTASKDKIARAFQTIVCRKPQRKELSTLSKYHDLVLSEMKNVQAESLLKVGESALADVPVMETAALMQTIQMIYNLEESTMR